MIRGFAIEGNEGESNRRATRRRTRRRDDDRRVAIVDARDASGARVDRRDRATALAEMARGASATRRRSARLSASATKASDDSDVGTRAGDAMGGEEATETFNFTPINAMRSLENVELSAEREGGMGKRARRASTPAAKAAKDDAGGENFNTDDVETTTATTTTATTNSFTFAMHGDRRESKTFWATQSERKRLAPLAHTNGLPPTPAVYNAVPWPSSIPLREKSPLRGVPTMYGDACVTPDGREFQGRVQGTTVSARMSPLVMEPLATTPKELAAQLVEVKREISKRQSEAVDVTRTLRQLQREEADLYARAAAIQRQLLECTSDEQPYDLNVTVPSKGVAKLITLENELHSNEETQRRVVREEGSPLNDQQPSTSEITVNAMQPFQKLDVRKSLISLDFIDGPGGLSLLTASADDCLRLWAPDSRKPAALMRAPRGMSATTVMNERIVCVGTDMGQIVQMDLATGQIFGALTQGEHAAPWSVKTLTKVGRDAEQLVAAAGSGGDIKVWDARIAMNGGAPMVMYSHGASEIRGLSFSSDGRTVVAAASNDLRVFDLRMNGRSTRMNVASDSQPSWTSVLHDASTSEIITTSSVGDVYAWSTAAPYPLSRTVAKACAPNSGATVATAGALLCASGADASDVDFVRHSSGEVVARWSPESTERACVTCVAVSDVGARAQPYAAGSFAAGTASGTVVVFASS